VSGSPSVGPEEREARAAFLAGSAELTPYVAVEIGDELFFVRGGDPGVGKRLFVARWRSDMTVIDRPPASSPRTATTSPARRSSTSVRTSARRPSPPSAATASTPVWRSSPRPTTSRCSG
jgi:hypothetical protein